MTKAYDPSNIFAKILRGEAPCVRVHEDDVSLAFLDIMPRGAGHTLVINGTTYNGVSATPAVALWSGLALRPPGGPMVAAAELEPIATKIRSALA